MTKRATTGKANRNPVRASTSDSGEGRSHAEARPVPLSGRTPTCCPKRRCTPRPEPRFVHLAILTCPAGRPGRVRPIEEHVLSCTDARVVLGCASKWSDIGARAIGALAQRYLSKPHSPPRGRSRGTTRRLTPRTALLRPFPSIGARTAPRNRKYLFHRGGHHRSNLLRAPGDADARALRGRAPACHARLRAGVPKSENSIPLRGRGWHGGHRAGLFIGRGERLTPPQP